MKMRFVGVLTSIAISFGILPASAETIEYNKNLFTDGELNGTPDFKYSYLNIGNLVIHSGFEASPGEDLANKKQVTQYTEDNGNKYIGIKTDISSTAGNNIGNVAEMTITTYGDTLLEPDTVYKVSMRVKIPEASIHNTTGKAMLIPKKQNNAYEPILCDSNGNPADLYTDGNISGKQNYYKNWDGYYQYLTADEWTTLETYYMIKDIGNGEKRVNVDLKTDTNRIKGWEYFIDDLRLEVVKSGAAAPEAQNVTVTSDVLVTGATINGTYTYFDKNNDPEDKSENGTSCGWYISDAKNGTFVKTADGSSVTLDEEIYANKYIKFGVIPKSTKEPNSDTVYFSEVKGPVTEVVYPPSENPGNCLFSENFDLLTELDSPSKPKFGNVTFINTGETEAFGIENGALKAVNGANRNIGIQLNINNLVPKSLYRVRIDVKVPSKYGLDGTKIALYDRNSEYIYSSDLKTVYGKENTSWQYVCFTDSYPQPHPTVESDKFVTLEIYAPAKTANDVFDLRFDAKTPADGSVEFYLDNLEVECIYLAKQTPVGSNPKMEGAPVFGGVIEGSFDYTDYENDDEGESIYNWYISDTGEYGSFELYKTGKILELDDTGILGKYIRLGIIPVSVNSPYTGNEIFCNRTKGPVKNFGTESLVGEKHSIYVSPNGSDLNDGTFERPFKTFDRAKLEARISADYGYSVIVNFREGEYKTDKALVLGEADSGKSADRPIIYQAYNNERVVFSGTEKINSNYIYKVEDKKLLKRVIDENARDHIYAVDLNCIDNLVLKPEYKVGRMKNVWNSNGKDRTSRLIINGEMGRVARWPNDKFAMCDITDPGVYGASAEESDGFTASISGNRLKKWKESEKNMLVYGAWTNGFTDQSAEVENIDTVNNTIKSADPVEALRMGTNRPYYVYNLPEEIDMPGEYYIDRDNYVLYFYADGDVKNYELELTSLNGDMVIVENASNITVKNIEFNGCIGNGVKISNSENICFDGCTLKNLNSGFSVSKTSRNCGLINSVVKNTAAYSVVLNGGNKKTLEHGGNYLINSVIDNSGEEYYASGTGVGGVGQIVRNCTIKNTYHTALTLSGMEHTIEYCDFEDNCVNASDAGVIYGGFEWASYGTVIRYNYFHGLKSTYGNNGVGVAGIYLDEGYSGVQIYGNIIDGIGTGVSVAGGNDITIENNIFVNTNIGISINRFMYWKNWNGDRTEIPDYNNLKQHIEALSDEEMQMQREKYPHMFLIMEDLEKVPTVMGSDGHAPDAALPRYNVIKNNIIENANTDTNIYQHPTTVVKDNYIFENDPGFADAASHRFTLENNKYFSQGFVFADTAKMGAKLEKTEVGENK